MLLHRPQSLESGKATDLGQPNMITALANQKEAIFKPGGFHWLSLGSCFPPQLPGGQIPGDPRYVKSHSCSQVWTTFRIPLCCSLSEVVEKTARVLPQSSPWVQGPETAKNNPCSAVGFPERPTHCGNRRFLLPYQLLLRSTVTRTHQNPPAFWGVQKAKKKLILLPNLLERETRSC